MKPETGEVSEQKLLRMFDLVGVDEVSALKLAFRIYVHKCSHPVSPRVKQIVLLIFAL